jgi:hypothetical protein
MTNIPPFLEPPKWPIEITLPSGKFCTIRRVTFIDRAIALAIAAKSSPEFDDTGLDTTMKFVFVLISRVCLIDGAPVTPAQVGELDPQDGDAICTKLGQFLQGPVR